MFIDFGLDMSLLYNVLKEYIKITALSNNSGYFIIFYIKNVTFSGNIHNIIMSKYTTKCTKLNHLKTLWESMQANTNNNVLQHLSKSKKNMPPMFEPARG